MKFAFLLLIPTQSASSASCVPRAVWAVAHHHNAEAQITLPIGRVTVTELLKVLHALEAARSSQNRFTVRSGHFRTI